MQRSEDCSVASSIPQSVPFMMVDNKSPLIGSHQYGVCWDGNVSYRSGEYWPYRFNITGMVTTSYDSSHNLIVTLTDIRMIPAGANDIYGKTKPYSAPWYGSIESNVAAWRAMALAVVATPNANHPQVPAANDPVWHKCLGGWYAAGVSCATECNADRWGNKPGGTYYYWSDTSGNGTPFSKQQYQSGARSVPDQTWNLGPIHSGDGVDPKIWIIAFPQQVVQNSDPNCNIPFYSSSFVSGVSVDVQMLTICPPEILKVEQQPNNCDNCVDVKLHFDANELGGLGSGTLEVEFKYEGQDWGESSFVNANAYANQPTEVYLGCLIPSRKVIWRARYTIGASYNAESDYSGGEFEPLFIPPISMVVPDIDATECTAITQGKEIPIFDHLTNYWREDLS